MKTKIFLLICLFTGILTIQLSAQNGKNGTGTVPFVNTFVDVGNSLELEIVCEGVVVDVLYFPVSYDSRGLIHYNDGEIKWEKYHFNNVSFTSRSGETFKMQHMEIITEEGLDIWKSHLIGNKGNNYRVEMARDLETWEIVYINTTCYLNTVFLE